MLAPARPGSSSGARKASLMNACPNCGAIPGQYDRFCNSCGTALTAPPAAAQAAPNFAANADSASPALAPTAFGGPPVMQGPPQGQWGAPTPAAPTRCQLGHDIAAGQNYCAQGHPLALDGVHFAGTGPPYPAPPVASYGYPAPPVQPYPDQRSPPPAPHPYSGGPYMPPPPQAPRVYSASPAPPPPDATQYAQGGRVLRGFLSHFSRTRSVSSGLSTPVGSRSADRTRAKRSKCLSPIRPFPRGTAPSPSTHYPDRFKSRIRARRTERS